jgi:hypothetical protein
VRVLAAEAQDQSMQRRLERRPTGSPLRIRPAASDQLTVPAQQRLGLDREARPQATRGSERLSVASSARSARVSFGCRACRRSIASSWRSTRISSSFERRGRASSQTSANRFRTARYANDQSKQPSLDHDSKSADPSQVAVGEQPDEFANPTASSPCT